MKIFLLLLLIPFLSCSKKTESEKDRELPVISLSSPQTGQVFAPGQTVGITGDLTDNKGLYEVHVHISDAETGSLLIDIHRYPDNTVYHLAESFEAAAARSYKIQVIARDNSANEARTTVEISAN